MIILLISHIFISLTTVFYTAYELFRPSKPGLKICWTLLALTILTGTILIISQPVNLTQTCIEGLVYVGLMLAGILFAQKRLAAQKA